VVNHGFNRAILLTLAVVILLGASCKLRSATLPAAAAQPQAGQQLQPVDRTNEFPGQATRWAGLSWYTLGIFNANGAAASFFTVPGTGEDYAALFDFTIADGKIWIPNSTMSFSDPSIVQIEATDPFAKHDVIRLRDPVSASDPSIAVPFNVAADEKWLYILRKYSLYKSQLTRMSLSDTSVCSSIVLPADGGGLSNQMAIGTLDGLPVLAVMLQESCAIIDRASFKQVGFCQDSRLHANIVYSKHLGEFVCAGVAESFDISSPAEAGEYQSTVVQDRAGAFSYSVPEVITIKLSGGNASISVRKVKLGSPVAGVQAQPTSTFDLNDSGTVAVCQDGAYTGLHAIDLETMAIVDTQRYPAGQVLGGIGCIGGDVFAIGGGLVYGFASRQMKSLADAPFTGCRRIEPLQ
jgi:hypothetical protein